MRNVLVVPLFLAAGLSAACFGRAAEEKRLPQIPWQKTKDLEVEPLGRPLGSPVVALLPLMRVGDTDRYVQPLWYRAKGRNIHLCSLDLQKGAARLHKVIPAYQVWRTAVVGGKLYLGFNVPAWLVVYDPATGAYTNLGKAFKKAITVFRLVPGPGGLLCAGANGSTEVSIYDPEWGRWTRYDALSEGHQFVYYASHDADWIYGACRGRGPWRLVALNKKTRGKRILLEAPVSAHMTIAGDVATTIIAGKRTYYRLEQGKAVQLPGPPRPRRTETPQPAPPKPDVMYDAATVYADGRLTLYYRLPADRPAKEDPKATPEANGWRTARLDVGLETKNVTRLLRYDDHTIVGTSGAYGPMFRYDIQEDRMSLLGPAPGNAYSIARSGGRVYVSGYPNTWFAAVDPFAPFTPTRDLPGRPAVAKTAPNANPRLIVYFGSRRGLQAHTGVRLHTAPDGRVYVIGMRHRYFKGFALGVYDPATGEAQRVEDGGRLNHLQVAWSTPVDGGKRLAITTWVQPNDHYKDSPVPTAAKIFLFDMTTGKFVREYTPFPDEKALLTAVQLRDGRLLGLVTEERYPKQSRTLIYTFDLATGKVLKTRAYGTVITGVTGKLAVPRRPATFLLGPDGYVWTLYRLGSVKGYPQLLVRIHPETLDVLPVGRVGAAGQCIFVGRDLYLAGDSRLRRVKDVILPQDKVKAQ